MATIDPRLLSLVETLIAAEADWLAVELLETLNRGRWPEESEEVLAATREMVRAGIAEKRDIELAHKSVMAVPIPVEEQVAWAADFVALRLGAALDDLSGSLSNLDAIIGRDPDDRSAIEGDHRPMAVRLGDDDGAAAVSADDIEQARAGLQPLRAALARWSRDPDGILA